MTKHLITCFGFLILLSLSSKSQDFVYTAKNPAFGGSPYNYSWLLSSAQAQDTYNAPDDGSSSYRNETNAVDDFSESLNRQILSQLSRQIVSRQFGEDALEDGTYLLGDYQIEIGNSGSGLEITILDLVSGSTTNVSVPYF